MSAILHLTFKYFVCPLHVSEWVIHSVEKNGSIEWNCFFLFCIWQWIGGSINMSIYILCDKHLFIQFAIFDCWNAINQWKNCEWQNIEQRTKWKINRENTAKRNKNENLEKNANKCSQRNRIGSIVLIAVLVNCIENSQTLLKPHSVTRFMFFLRFRIVEQAK